MSCQSPVNPGFTCSLIVPLRVLIHDKRHLRSRATSDMLPCKTFSSCGNSSRLVRRRIVPTLVILESSEVPKNHMEMHGCAWFGICAVPTTSAQRKALYSSLRSSTLAAGDRTIRTSALGLPALAHLLGNLVPEATQLLGSQCFVLRSPHNLLRLPYSLLTAGPIFCQSSSDPAHRKY